MTAAVTAAAFTLAPAAGAHSLPATRAEINGGILGAIHHARRNLAHEIGFQRFLQRVHRRPGVRWSSSLDRHWKVHNDAEKRTRRRLGDLLRRWQRAQNVVDPVWEALARCETGGDWFRHGLPRSNGGLGILNSTWLYYRPSGWPTDAGLATKAQQVAVARMVLRDSGPARGWPGKCYPLAAAAVGH